MFINPSAHISKRECVYVHLPILAPTSLYERAPLHPPAPAAGTVCPGSSPPPTKWAADSRAGGSGTHALCTAGPETRSAPAGISHTRRGIPVYACVIWVCWQDIYIDVGTIYRVCIDPVPTLFAQHGLRLAQHLLEYRTHVRGIPCGCAYIHSLHAGKNKSSNFNQF